jgi:hypothetical protein
MSADKPCADCGPADTYTRAEKMLALVGLFAGVVIGYMAVDIMTGGRLSAALGRALGVSRDDVGGQAEQYLQAQAHDR